MRVLVDALSATTGAGLTFVSSQLRALHRLRPDIRMHVLVSRDSVMRLLKQHSTEIEVVSRASVASRVFYEQAIMARRFRDVDVLYCPGNFCPILPLGGPPIVLVQQNLHYFGEGRSRKMPQNALRKRIEVWLAHESVRRADLVAVVSEYLYSQIAAEGLPTRKCHILRYGVDPWPTGNSSLLPDWDFFLAVGHDYPHKRLSDLVSAWSRSFSSDGPGLFIVGRISLNRQRELASLVATERQSRLRLLSEVLDRGTLRALFENAIATVATSELESASLVSVEAGSIGCPLILSDIPAHREVAGSRAEYFPVGDTDTLQSILRSHRDAPRPRRNWHDVPTWDDNAGHLAALLERSIA